MMGTIKGLLGKKLGMLEVYDENRRLVPVTMIQAGPCRVVQVKSIENDGYLAAQVGFREVSERKLNSPQLGHLKKYGARNWRYVSEFPCEGSVEPGEIIGLNGFSKGEPINVRAVSKGKGFQGVIKRHHFAGGPETHGHMFHRAPGSIGSSSYPSRVLKNKKLPGQMGGKPVTVKGLRVIDVRVEDNVLLISGSVPGPVGGLVEIRKVGSSL
jgi:large subunit ribosomal protein L3